MYDGTLVVIHWKDIVGDDNWQTRGEAKEVKPHGFISVGWLIRKDKESIVIASCYSPDDDTVGSVTSIPMGAVLEVKTIRSHRMPNFPDSCKRFPKK